jgi:hypothetical protein
MKSIVLFFFVVGIVMLAVGYQKKILKSAMETKTVVEYRFIPRSIYDQQMSPDNMESTFSDMFEKEDVFMRID